MKRSTLEIRPFRDDDRAAIVDLWRVCFPDDPPHNDPDKVIERKRPVQPELFLVGCLEGRVVCTVIGGYDGYRGWVYHLATAPQHRRKGLGRQMMNEVEGRLADIGCPKLNLQVRATNEAVVAFYEALGYRIEDRVSLGKRLGARAGRDHPATPSGV
jgi:ribosomal protein S18 acetylase RimI-like enzyme